MRFIRLCNPRLSAALLALTLALGCTEGREAPLAPPADASVPDASHAGGPGQLHKSSLLVVRYQAANAQVVSAVLDWHGGEIRADGHLLVVPRGAVSEPTLFVVTVPDSPYILVDLKASRVSDGAEVTQFETAVKLRLSYRSGIVPHERMLRVAYLVDGSTSGRLELLQSRIDANGKYVDARLSHFSQYAIALE